MLQCFEHQSACILQKFGIKRIPSPPPPEDGELRSTSPVSNLPSPPSPAPAHMPTTELGAPLTHFASHHRSSSLTHGHSLLLCQTGYIDDHCRRSPSPMDVERWGAPERRHHPAPCSDHLRSLSKPRSDRKRKWCLLQPTADILMATSNCCQGTAGTP
jgi:hypothetical protein